MIVKAWNHEKHDATGNGYGLAISITDCDRYFRKDYLNAVIELEGENRTIRINTNKKSFWGDTCRELISKEIGLWLIKNHLAPWEKNHPPKLNLTPLGENRYRLSRLGNPS